MEKKQKQKQKQKKKDKWAKDTIVNSKQREKFKCLINI